VFYSASQYVALHKEFDNASSTEFMGRVKVTYDNGTVVCVNRSPDPWKVSDIGESGGWFTYNTTEGLDTGRLSSTRFTLKPYAGWVCYNPFFSPPSVPILVSPLSGWSVSTVPVELKWERTPGAEFYAVQVATTPDFVGSLLVDLGDVRTQILRLDPATLFQKYFWRVRASNARGISDWSKFGRFEVVDSK
jgi:hypothetical protein